MFLSYSHADTQWARWLMRRLEAYRVPRRLRGRAAPIGVVGARIAPVFRDRDELPTTSDLGETIRAALRESETLVVVCSPTAAKSRWVKEEILAFKRLHGERPVFGFIVGGEPKAEGAEADCFSPALRAEVGADGELSTRPAEIVAADARAVGDRRELALVRLIAGLLGVGFDELRQREQARRLRRMTWIAAGAIVGLAVMIGLAVSASRARDTAQRQQEHEQELLVFMLGDLRSQLVRLGKLEVLDSLGDKLLGYFATLEPSDLTDATLVNQAKTLRQLGEVRVAQARYPEAARCFMPAYERLAALAARHPKNGAMLFERGQAEYWIGFVHRSLGNLVGTAAWFTRYRDTGVALVGLEAGRQDWILELSSGQHNLAVVRHDRGELEFAREEFTAKLETLRNLMVRAPENLEYQFRTADTQSWLGSVAEKRGEFAGATAHFTAQVNALTAITQADPASPKWKYSRAVGLSLLANLLALSGERAAAAARIAESCRLADELVALDPANREWLRNSLRFRLRQAELFRAAGELGTAAASSTALIASYEKISATGTLDRLTRDHLSAAWRLEAQLRQALGRADANEAIKRALAVDETQLKSRSVNDATLGACAMTLVVAAQIVGAATPTAMAHATRAFELLAPRLKESRDWHLLDPAARALALIGRREESLALIARLQGFGFQPLEPWPAEPLFRPHQP